MVETMRISFQMLGYPEQTFASVSKKKKTGRLGFRQNQSFFFLLLLKRGMEFSLLCLYSTEYHCLPAFVSLIFIFLFFLFPWLNFFVVAFSSPSFLHHLYYATELRRPLSERRGRGGIHCFEESIESRVVHQSKSLFEQPMYPLGRVPTLLWQLSPPCVGLCYFFFDVFWMDEARDIALCRA